MLPLNIKEIKNNKNVLYKRIVRRFCFTFIVLILIILLFIINFSTLKRNEIITIVFCIVIYSLVYMPKNIKRLKILLNFKKKQVDELEEKIRTLKKDYCDQFYLFDNYLIRVEKTFFEIIKYEDIVWIFNEAYFGKRRLSFLFDFLFDFLYG